MLKLFTLFSIFNLSLSQNLMVPGSQRDDHGCVLDGGYQWCESTQSCQRLWEVACPEEPIMVTDPVPVMTESDFCANSNIQMCRMACADPICPTGQCAMRHGNCCDYTCVDNSLSVVVDCQMECPLIPCPMPAVMPGCSVSPPTYDTCGCQGCPTIDCSTSPQTSKTPQIPWNCAEWYDGCNTCGVSEGQLQACTMMMCFTNNQPYCMSYYSGDLQQGDVCYRFCEDGSMTPINRRNDCPKGTQCVSENSDVIGFDSCNNVMRCVPTNGH